MPSTFAWLDHSEEQRRQMLDVLDLFKEKSTVDELGLGTIRDAFSDLFFPGTSAPQTRARYFLFVPWTYLRLERQRVGSGEIAKRARKEEVGIIESLLGVGESDGVIGRFAHANLQRLPSNIYWSGLRRLGICWFNGSQDLYHRSLDRFYGATRAAVVTDDREVVTGVGPNWHPSIPAPRPEFPVVTSLKLTPVEADYLRERIATRAPGSLFAYLVTTSRASDIRDVEFPWLHPSYAELSGQLRDQLEHARRFSEVMHGANLLYNLLLSELSQNPEFTNEYQSRLTEWAETTVEPRMPQLREWDRASFWRCVTSEGARVPPQAKMFVEHWCDLVIDGSGLDVATNVTARSLVANRERQLKRALARVDNPRARELWQGESGTSRLSYRWSNARRIAIDILEPLENPDA